jgi:hypothetical protein
MVFPSLPSSIPFSLFNYFSADACSNNDGNEEREVQNKKTNVYSAVCCRHLIFISLISMTATKLPFQFLQSVVEVVVLRVACSLLHLNICGLSICSTTIIIQYCMSGSTSDIPIILHHPFMAYMQKFTGNHSK